MAKNPLPVTVRESGKVTRNRTVASLSLASASLGSRSWASVRPPSTRKNAASPTP